MSTSFAIWPAERFEVSVKVETAFLLPFITISQIPQAKFLSDGFINCKMQQDNFLRRGMKIIPAYGVQGGPLSDSLCMYIIPIPDACL